MKYEKRSKVSEECHKQTQIVKHTSLSALCEMCELFYVNYLQLKTFQLHGFLGVWVPETTRLKTPLSFTVLTN